jgi:hypothetical protein
MLHSGVDIGYWTNAGSDGPLAVAAARSAGQSPPGGGWQSCAGQIAAPRSALARAAEGRPPGEAGPNERDCRASHATSHPRPSRHCGNWGRGRPAPASTAQRSPGPPTGCWMLAVGPGQAAMDRLPWPGEFRSQHRPKDLWGCRAAAVLARWGSRVVQTVLGCVAVSKAQVSVGSFAGWAVQLRCGIGRGGACRPVACRNNRRAPG